MPIQTLSVKTVGAHFGVINPCPLRRRMRGTNARWGMRKPRWINLTKRSDGRAMAKAVLFPTHPQSVDYLNTPTPTRIGRPLS